LRRLQLFFHAFSWLSGNQDSLETITLGILTYNTIAFGLQPIFGYIADTYKNIPIAAIGCMLLIIGLLFIKYPWAALSIMGIGNACFHVGGGIDSLKYSNGKMARSGIFVSSGALGVSLGGLAGKSTMIPLYLPVVLLILCLIAISIFSSPDSDKQYKAPDFKISNPIHSFGMIIALCFFSIVIRSYAGSIIPMDWKTTMFLSVLPSIGACVGKASGGILADRLGARNVGVFSLLASVPCLVFGHGLPWICFIGILLFNMSMSITLCTIASLLPSNPGLAFGITTLALLCGSVPMFFFTVPGASIVIAVLTILSSILLYHAVINHKEKENEKNIQNYEQQIL